MRLKENSEEVIEEKMINLSKPSEKVSISDARVLLNSGKMGLIFIGVIVGFFVISLLLTFLHLSIWAYVIIGLISAPLLFFYYLKIHENDENKLD